MQERVEKAGGQVLYWNGHRVMGVLAMSRAIGDHCLRPYVIPEPEVRGGRSHDNRACGVNLWYCEFGRVQALRASSPWPRRLSAVSAMLRMHACEAPVKLDG